MFPLSAKKLLKKLYTVPDIELKLTIKKKIKIKKIYM